MKQVNVVINPLRSPIAALLLCVLLGPVGLIYASAVGALVMLFLFLVAYGTNSFYAIAMVWILCCFWGVIAANRYNRRVMHKMTVDLPIDDNQELLDGRGHQTTAD